jgi:ribose transport system permease protein
VWLVVILAVALWLVMHRTVFGRHLYAIGSNEATARVCDVRVPLVKVSGPWPSAAFHKRVTVSC